MKPIVNNRTHDFWTLAEAESLRNNFQRCVKGVVSAAIGDIPKDAEDILLRWVDVLKKQEKVSEALYYIEENSHIKLVSPSGNSCGNRWTAFIRSAEGMPIAATMRRGIGYCGGVPTGLQRYYAKGGALVFVPCNVPDQACGLCTVVNEAKFGPLVQSMLYEASLSASFMIAESNRSRAYKTMANRIAHLTSTPLAIARNETRNLQKSSPDPRLDRILEALDEANGALERAYLFGDEVATNYRDDFNAQRYIELAADRAGASVVTKSISMPEFILYGNRFRFFFALRDIFWCAMSISRSSSFELQHRKKGPLILVVKIPVRVPRGFEAELLFSPQHHIEVSHGIDGKGEMPAGTSLFLARQLLNEFEPRPDLKISLDRNGIMISVTFSSKKNAARI